MAGLGELDSFEAGNLAAGRERLNEGWRFEDSAASTGSYRYRARMEMPRPAPEGKRLVALKQLYRRLARRFHPDLVLDDADRAYRTDLMSLPFDSLYRSGKADRTESTV